MSKQRSAKPNPRGYPDFAATAIINQLIQTAVQPRGRFTYQPYDETQITAYLTDTGRGVFIARGCRGMIGRIAMYLKNESTTAARSITLLLTPVPNGGEIRTVTLTQAMNTTGWVESPDLRLTWNYDSLAIIVKSIEPELRYAYYQTYDYGLGGLDDYPNTRGSTYHPLVWVRFDALSVGDIPVSGTINAIMIPSVSSFGASGSVYIPAGETKTLIDISGAGQVEWTYLRAGMVRDTYIDVIWEIDGVETTWNLDLINSWSHHVENTPTDVVATKIDDTALIYRLQLRWKLKFRRSFILRMRNTHSTDTAGCEACVMYSLIK